ncbi:MAG: TIGR00269 family protein [Candidatus Rokubacteria bacterium]|nr:TIGR00269 family protein [Candidatus Rokubacteria bacterium]
MKCIKCRGPAVLELRRHNAAFCAEDFLAFFRKQTVETIRKWKMFTREEPVLVAVSGGKDSLALWDVLLLEGYDATGLYLDLGIYDYSKASRARCEAFAAERGAKLHVVAVADEMGASIPEVKELTRRPTCSACGLSKRYLTNRVALEQGFPVVATGHNLDDEAATLLGSVLHWAPEALARQSPVLPASHPGFVRRVKPFFRISERETAAYAFLRGIDYIVEECPFSRGATSLVYKEVLNRLEEHSPGAKAAFFTTFLQRARPAFERLEEVELRDCARCGQPTTAEVCAFCRLAERVKRAGGDRTGTPVRSEAETDPSELRGLGAAERALP